MVRLRWGALLALALSLGSCDVIFQSYFPTQVEFQEQQIDLTAELGKTIASVSLGYLPKTGVHPQNLLVVLALTTDGQTTPLLYDADSLVLVRRYSGTDLVAQNGGVMPPLRLFGQDGTGVYLGSVKLTGSKLDVATGSFLPAFFTNNASTDMSQIRTTWNPTTASGFLWVTEGNSLKFYGASGANTYPQLGSSTPSSLPLSGYSTRLLDALQDGSDSFAVVSDSGQILLYEGASPLLWTAPAAVLSDGYYAEGGWATSLAAIVEGHADNAKELTALSWTGTVLGRLSLPDNRQTVALTFSPGGQWFLYESSTGKLSRNRPWWEKS